MGTRKFLIVMVVGALVAGCGGGSGKKPSASATSTTKPAAAPYSANQRAADNAIATDAVLKLDDFPLGWTGEEHKDSPDDDLQSRAGGRGPGRAGPEQRRDRPHREGHR